MLCSAVADHPDGVPSNRNPCRREVERVGTSSLTLTVAIALPDGSVALEGRVVAVAWDAENRRSRPLTEDEKRLVSATRFRSESGR